MIITAFQIIHMKLRKVKHKSEGLVYIYYFSTSNNEKTDKNFYASV